MRPRHYTAENLRGAGMAESDLIASMRPRHYTAENSHLAAPSETAVCGGRCERSAITAGKDSNIQF